MTTLVRGPRRGALMPRGAERISKTGPCLFDGCPLPRIARGYCSGHYQQRRADRPLAPLRDDSRRGAGYAAPDGYLYLWKNGSKVLAHRWIMQQSLGRPLAPSEQVHHKNGDRADNRLENLELWVVRQPKGQRVAERIEDAVAVLRSYAPHLLA